MKLRHALLLVVGALGVPQVAPADIASDRASAVLVFPSIQVSLADNLDTLVQISNTSNQLIAVRCFYVNANGHCSNTGNICYKSIECSPGSCVPGWSETDFRIYITAGQPLAWLASRGLSDFPLNGTFQRGPTGQHNAGSHVPPVPELPFSGELKCVVVDQQDRPTDQNVLVGAITMVQSLPGFVDVTRDSAVGLQAIPGRNDGDNRLVLGDEYEACPQTLIVNHFFDGATDPVSGVEIDGVLTLVPCSEDFLLQDQNLTKITAQFLVFNEFEQRFSTSTPIECYSLRTLSSIDTKQPIRSIFHVAVAGTLSGQTRIRGVGSNGKGLIGEYYDLHGRRSSAVNVHFQGVSDQPDVIRLP